MKVLIIIPIYNEAENITHVLDEIKEKCPDYDVLVIDDGSIDNSHKICRARNREMVVKLPANLGIGGARQTGFKYAVYNNYDIVVQLDGDGQHRPECMHRMIEAVVSGNNICVGSRFITREGFQSSALRRLGISILYWLIRILTGENITDPTSGYRVCDKKATRLFAWEYPHDYPEPGSIVTANKYGLKMCEVPVTMSERMSGNSSIGKKASVMYMIKVITAILITAIAKGTKKD